MLRIALKENLGERGGGFDTNDSGLAGKWTGRVSGFAEGSENGIPAAEPVQLDLDVTFNDKNQMVYRAGAETIVLTSPGQTFQYINNDGHLTTETVLELSITAAGGKFVTRTSTHSTHCYSGGSLAMASESTRTITLHRTALTLHAELHLEATTQSSVSTFDATDITNTHVRLQAEGTLRQR